MAASKKGMVSKSPGPSQDDPTPPYNPALDELLPKEQLDQLSTLQIVDLIAGKLPPRHTSLIDLVYLRDRIVEIEELNDQARQTVEKLDAIIEKLRSPAFRVGTFIMPIEPDRGQVCLGGSDYVCRIDPALPQASLQIGQRVLCNEAFAVVQGLGFDRSGMIRHRADLFAAAIICCRIAAGLVRPDAFDAAFG